MLNKCDKCGKQSVYRSTLIVNGVSQTTNLCRDCAIKEGVFASEPTSLFEEMFSPFIGFMPFERVEDIVCPVCKTTLKQFKTSGLLGCSNCYDAFSKEISKIVGKIAPYAEHKQGSIKLKKQEKQTKEDKLAELKSELALAVKEERYEDAGKIKKQIQKLEAKDE